VSVRTASADTGARSAYRDAWRIYRAYPAALLVPGAVLFLAFGVPSVLVGEATTDRGPGAFLAALSGQTLGFLSSYVYYGYCEEVAGQARSGSVSVRRALQETQGVLWKLIAVSVIVEVLVVFGLLLLVVPGILLAARWGLVAPVASFERRWPRGAMRRSAELGKGHLGLVMMTAVAMFVAEQVASAAGEDLGAHAFGDHTIGAILGDAAGDLMVGPFAGLLIAIVYVRLSGRGAGATMTQGQA
jgi:hypothetical protein